MKTNRSSRFYVVEKIKITVLKFSKPMLLSSAVQNTRIDGISGIVMLSKLIKHQVSNMEFIHTLLIHSYKLR